MVLQSSINMATVSSMNGSFDDDFERDIEALVRDQQQNRTTFDLDREELNIFRSGSAPPTVEGARTAFGSLFGYTGFDEGAGRLGGRDAVGLLSEEEMRSHPAYLSYYYSNENLNPRMPPPAVSKEDWRARQRASLFGKIGDRRRTKESANGDESASSLFSLQPGFLKREGEREMMEPDKGMLQQNLSRQQLGEWHERSTDGLFGLPDAGLGPRKKSFADVLQEELSRPTYDNGDPVRVLDSQVTQLHNGSEALGGLRTGATSSSRVRGQSVGSSISHSFASASSSSLSRSATPDPRLIQRSSSPCLPPVGSRHSDSVKHSVVGYNGLGGVLSRTTEYGDVATAMSSLSLSKNTITDGVSHILGRFNQEFSDQPEVMFDIPDDNSQFLQHKVDKSGSELLRSSPNHLMGNNDTSKKSDSLTSIHLHKTTSNGQIDFPKGSFYPNVYKKVYSDGATSSAGYDSQLSPADIEFSVSNPMTRSGFHGLPAMSNNQLNSAGAEGDYLNIYGNQGRSGFQVPILYSQYLQGASDPVLHAAASLDPSLARNYVGASHMDLPEYRNAYAGALLAHQKLQYGIPLLSKSSGLNHGFYGSHAFGFGVPYSGSPISNTIHSPLTSGSHVRQSDRSSRSHSAMSIGDSIGSWSIENGAIEDCHVSSLLEEFKNSKTKSFELSDIVGHVVEFSADQYGSRFIQQKLETSSDEEKNKIFLEILPKAHSLITDVFGNYVIQKFFEHGTEIQRKQLASQLSGHVLPLSLQMYGCRVIQKALEAVDVDQQTQMVLELDGHIMKCVRDQNGNHVIQKCIECVPKEKIQFIIEAFYGHVVALSTHPYGCRVIQRVLEHCDDPKTQSIVMDEIMQAICTLAQDQYGNYVIQHVLQHGKPEERSAIISKLSGQIVKMSQQKYASNVVEKCLTFGTPEERQLLINEMLGSTEENEPLQAMMKDQFANYVVQKVLETCDDYNRQLILSRIKVHLNALKKYTYGKHIVARVEKLVTAGERRIGVSSHSS